MEPEIESLSRAHRRIAIFAEQAGNFLRDTHHDLLWLLRAVHHFGVGHEFTGAEELPDDSASLCPETLKGITLIQEQMSLQTWAPRPTTGPEYYPDVYVVDLPTDAELDLCWNALLKLRDVRFSRGGCIEVLQVPANPWCRNSPQDVDAADAWAWGTLMPLYFREVGAAEPKWLVDFFATDDSGFHAREVERGHLQAMWNVPDGKLFARSVQVALLHTVTPGSVVRVLAVFQPGERGGVWALPGGSIDRGLDTTWEAAAWREFEEEVNPSGSQEWSSACAVDKSFGSARISIQNLIRCGAQNMSRPTLNFVLARATDDFVRMVDTADKHPNGDIKLPLPDDYVTMLPHLQDEPARGNFRRYWREKDVPLVEHDACRWIELDLEHGKPRGKQVHRYICVLAAALQSEAAPRMKLRKQNSQLIEEGSQGHRRWPPNPFGEARAVATGHVAAGGPQEISPGVYKVESERDINKLFADKAISMSQMRQAKLDIKSQSASLTLMVGG